MARTHLRLIPDLDEAPTASHGDPVLMSSVLDAVVAIRLSTNDVAGAMQASLLRIDPLEPQSADPIAGYELKDALHTPTILANGAGETRPQP